MLLFWWSIYYLSDPSRRAKFRFNHILLSIVVSAQTSDQLTRKTEISGHTRVTLCVCVCVCVCARGGFKGDICPQCVSMVPSENKLIRWSGSEGENVKKGVHRQISLRLNFPSGSSDKEMWGWSLSWKDPSEKETATQFSILAWRTPWTDEPEGLQSMGSQRVEHDWSDWVHTWWLN